MVVTYSCLVSDLNHTTASVSAYRYIWVAIKKRNLVSKSFSPNWSISTILLISSPYFLMVIFLVYLCLVNSYSVRHRTKFLVFKVGTDSDSTFKEFGESLILPLFISWCYNHGIKKAAQSLVNIFLISWYKRVTITMIWPAKNNLILGLTADSWKANLVTPIFYYRIFMSRIRHNFWQSLKKILKISPMRLLCRDSWYLYLSHA